MIRKIWNEYRRSFCLEKYKKVSQNQGVIVLAYIVIVTLLNKDFHTLICLWSIGIPVVFGACTPKRFCAHQALWHSFLSQQERKNGTMPETIKRYPIPVTVEK